MNFSHENMTPLNAIINNGKLCCTTLVKLYEFLKTTRHPEKNELAAQRNSTLVLIRGIRQQGVMLWYYT